MTNFSALSSLLSSLSVLSSVLFATACGAVVDTQDDGLDHGDVVGDYRNDELDLGDGAGSAVPPIVLEPATLATDARSLAALQIADHAGILRLIADAAPRTVTEQRFVAQTDQVIELELELEAPTGMFGRTLGSDVIRNDLPHVEHVLCETNLIATFDPRCETRIPGPSGLPVSGALASGRWQMDVVEEASGASMVCATDGLKKTCTLPANKGATYRIVTAVGNVTDLWENTGIGIHTDLGRSYAGSYVGPEYQCWDWSTASGGRLYCETRYDYTRFVGLDRAWLAIDPLTVEITANGFVDAQPSPEIQWDSGNDDLPGSNY